MYKSLTHALRQVKFDAINQSNFVNSDTTDIDLPPFYVRRLFTAQIRSGMFCLKKSFYDVAYPNGPIFRRLWQNALYFFISLSAYKISFLGCLLIWPLLKNEAAESIYLWIKTLIVIWLFLVSVFTSGPSLYVYLYS